MSNLKQINKLRKEIEKISINLAGKEDKFIKENKKELMSRYKILFKDELMNNNINICEDLFEAAILIVDWYKEDKKLAKEYFTLSIKKAENIDQILKLGSSFSTYGDYRSAKKVLLKGEKKAKNFEEKWSLAEKFSIAREFDLAKKIGEEAISLLSDKKSIKEYKKELDKISSVASSFF